MSHDVFISHASEDKAAVARPLARALEAKGLSVWLDEGEITIGDSLRGSLDKGLAECRFGVVILSRHFFRKNWPLKELNGLAARENDGAKVILPVWHELTHDDVLKFSPMLADRLGASTEHGIDDVASKLVAAISKAGAIQGTAARGPDPLDALRARLLQAGDLAALRRIGYEIEAVVRADPANADARWLQDQVREAIERETIRTQPLPASPAKAGLRLVPIVAVLLAVVIAILIAAAYRGKEDTAHHESPSPQASASSLVVPASVPLIAPVAASSAASMPATVPLHGLVHFFSDRGDYIGDGKRLVFNDTNSRISVSGTRNAITVEVRSDDTWTFDFAAPEDAQLAVGDYEGAQRAAFHNPTRPGLDISGAARGCNTVSGRFSIQHITFDAHDAVSGLVATFEQHCEGKPAALRGSLELVAATP